MASKHSGSDKDLVPTWEKMGIAPTSVAQIPTILDIARGMSPRMTVCFVGETGIGKTPIVEQWTAARKGACHKLNFGHMTQEEISMVMFAENGGSFGFVPPEFLLRVNEDAKKLGLSVLFLDEWNRGDKALVNGLFTLTDERRIHDFKLHENVLVVAAMNPSDSAYLVNEAEKDHAIRKRLNFVYVTHDLVAFLEHTKKAGWHPLVPAFIKASNSFLYDTGARDAGKCFPCPSNWEKVSNILLSSERQEVDLSSTAVTVMVQGQIGTVAARKFMDFVHDQNTLIQPSDVLENYATKNSRVQKRVLGLIDKKRHDILTDLNRGIALELFSAMPTPSAVAESLGNYMGDLPNEILSSFAADSLYEHSKAKGAEGAAYLSSLSVAMQKVPAYKTKMKVIIDAVQRYKMKAKNSQEKDPAA